MPLAAVFQIEHHIFGHLTVSLPRGDRHLHVGSRNHHHGRRKSTLLFLQNSIFVGLRLQNIGKLLRSTQLRSVVAPRAGVTTHSIGKGFLAVGTELKEQLYITWL